MNAEQLWSQPGFGITLTLLAYVLTRQLNRRFKWVNPSLFTALIVMAVLYLTDIPYESYKAGGDVILLVLGPATVALGVPLYKQFGRIRTRLVPILSGITAGAASSLISAAALVWALGGAAEIVMAMLPKSVTSPVAIEITRQLGGTPELGATFAVLTGVLGSMIGPEFLRLCGVRTDVGIGTAVGTASHGIGTSRVLPESEFQGSLSGFAMAANCIITSVLMIPIYGWMQ